MFSGSTLSKQVPSQSHTKALTDRYKSLDDKELEIHSSEIALVSSDQWKSKACTEISGGMTREVDLESAVPWDAIGITRNVDVSSMVVK